VRRTAAKYPRYSFAFKVDGPTAQTEVERVEWNVGKTRRLAPTAVIKTVVLGDRNNSRASAHNARYVVDGKIGPGAVVEIVRSGGTIPKIIKVVKTAKPALPDRDYKWDPNKVHIIAEGDEAKEEACLRRMQAFFKALGVKELGAANLRKMYDNGLNTVLGIMSASEAKISEAVESQASGKKIWGYVQKARTDMDVPYALGASGILGDGVGIERTVALADAVPDIFERGASMSRAAVKAEVLKVPKFGDSMASLVADNIKWASVLTKSLQKLVISKTKGKPPPKKSDQLKGELIVVTGFTDPELEKEILAHGGKYTAKWSKGVTAVVAGKKSLEKGSNKIDKAEEAGVPVYSDAEYREKLAELQEP
jgi:NAD-dependent DNA ligase